MKLRLAVPEDAPNVARIWMEGVLASSGHSAPPVGDVIDGFERRIREPVGKSVVWVATVGVEFAGWQGLQDFGITQISRIAQSSTYISRHSHGRGVGQRLCSTHKKCPQAWF